MMILHGVRRLIPYLGVCSANDPKKVGYITPAPMLDLTTSLWGYFKVLSRVRPLEPQSQSNSGATLQHCYARQSHPYDWTTPFMGLSPPLWDSQIEENNQQAHDGDEHGDGKDKSIHLVS